MIAGGLNLASPVWAEAGTAVAASQTEMELIHVDGGSPSLALRHANIVPGSLQVQLDGAWLREGKDFALDANRGLIVLYHATRPGQSLRATYRYSDHALASTATSSGLGFGYVGGLGLPKAGGSKVLLGFGLAERRADGTTVQGNVYGLNNRFGFHGGSLSGIYLAGDQRHVSSMGLMDGSQGKKQGDEGRSQAIVQSLSVANGKTGFHADVQDIGKKFNGFSAFQDAGYTDAQVGAFDKEKGLKRYALGFNANGLTTDYRTVKDGKSSIQWRSFGYQGGAWSMNYSSQVASQSFTRFNDLQEADHAQLAKEAGITRNQFSTGYAAANQKFSLNQIHAVQSSSRGKFDRRDVSAASGATKFNFREQTVQSNFTNPDSLRLPDGGQVNREKGMHRTDFAVETAPIKGGPTWSFDQLILRHDDHSAGRASSQDLALGTKNISFEHHAIGSNGGTSGLQALSDGEINKGVQTVAHMYSPSGLAVVGGDPGALRNNGDVNRTGDRLGWSAGKTGFGFEQVRLGDAKGSGLWQRWSANNSALSLNFERTDLGSGFNSFGGLLENERGKLGTLNAIRRADWKLNWTPKTGSAFAFTNTSLVHAGKSGLDRQTFAWSAPKTKFAFNTRKVGQAFNEVTSVNDPEKDLLGQLKGFEEKDWSFQSSVVRGMALNFNDVHAKNADTGIKHDVQTRDFKYALNKETTIGFSSSSDHTQDNSVLKNSSDRQTLNVSRELGKFGKLTYETETIRHDGTADTTPGSKRATYELETKLSSKADLITSQTSIHFDDGTGEQQRSNTLKTELSPRTGVSLSDTQIDRTGDKPKEHRHDYGFWWDLGGGMRFSYNTQRSATTAGNGSGQSQLSLTPGMVGAVAVGATYSEKVTDRTRFQDSGLVQVETKRPLQLGAFRDVNLKFGADTQRDGGQFRKENRAMAAGFRFGLTHFGWDYNSQVAANGDLAVDRKLMLATDKDPKRPLQLALSYKTRTLPGHQHIIIRDYDLAYRFHGGLTLSHQLQTNPEVANGGVILGSTPQANRASKWKLDFGPKGDTRFGLSWDELANDQAHTLSRTAGLNLVLRANNPSPISLFYGLEQNDNATNRRAIHRYSLRYDQRPGPNQYLSLFVGNVSWQHSRDAGVRVQNWSMRAEYQIRF